MSEKFEVKTGTMAVEMFCIVNYQEVRDRLGEKLVNPKCETLEDKKELKLKLEEYSSIRQPVVSTRANANKVGKAKLAEILAQFDEVKNLVDDYKLPINEAIEEYDKEIKAKKLERKKTIFLPQIEEANIAIREINESFGKDLILTIEWDDKFANMKDEKVVMLLEDEVQKAVNQKQQIENNILAVATKAESLKIQYDLQSELNYKLILGDRIYTDGLAELQDRLEDFAADQQRSDIEAAKKEREKIEREKSIFQKDTYYFNPESDNYTMYKKGEKIPIDSINFKHCYEVTKEEYSDGLKKQEEARKRQQEENKRIEDARVKIQSEENVLDKNEVTETNHGIERAKTASRTIYFSSLTKSQMVEMLDFFDENNIKFEVI